ncbi:hypothetical protein J2X72_003272 [Phyllobacterium sp. 1468]|nr:hypothetical protein [Phyllobacterium sp. 1468]
MRIAKIYGPQTYAPGVASNMENCIAGKHVTRQRFYVNIIVTKS